MHEGVIWLDENRKPSEVLEEILAYMKACQKEYQECSSAVWKHDRCVQDFLHEFEFSASKQERNKIATRLSRSRKELRRLKDRAQMLENVAKFYGDKSNRQFFDRLKNLINEQKKVEEYLESERVYKPRGSDSIGHTD